ncbi:hypothetical protein PRIPAC_93348 [Pristionchus pacificus]|uniref:Uncharacterized protein n=1 Tax=Pristionchus pacificus TaxID=54126 RepID=A0A2A6CDQ1_PRIPA|nr:hypothetical protein PRIPAC_93348 [Pristionchus pacificus]|eukprot:PDM76342.1 hypothetical protein PRIPAC_39946 [Pristionchus pacificus]
MVKTDLKGCRERKINIIELLGTGDYYSSGNHFTPSTSGVVDASELAHDAGYSQFVIKIIEHRKILFALVNGPAFGIAATTLCLIDYVVCSDSAYFGTPFPYIGVSPEGCASVMFEKVLGTSKASEAILFGEPISAADALKRGIVARVFPQAQFRKDAAALVEKFSELPKHSVLASKELMRGDKFRREMLAVHDDETRLIKKLFMDEKTISLIKSKFTKAKI